MKTHILLAALAALLAAACCPAAEKPLDRDTVVKLFGKLEKLNEKLKTVKAKLTKEVLDELLDDPIVSSGIFQYTKPNRMRMDIAKPKKLALTQVLVDQTLKIHYPESKRGEVYKLGKSKGIFEDLSFKLGDLEKKFKVAVFKEKVPAPKRASGPEKDGKDGSKKAPKPPERLYRVVLVPKKDQKELQEKMSALTIWTDGESAWPQAIRTDDSEEGISTTYRFSDVKQNVEIPDKAYVLKWPRRTKVTRYEK